MQNVSWAQITFLGARITSAGKAPRSLNKVMKKPRQPSKDDPRSINEFMYDKLEGITQVRTSSALSSCSRCLLIVACSCSTPERMRPPCQARSSPIRLGAPCTSFCMARSALSVSHTAKRYTEFSTAARARVWIIQCSFTDSAFASVDKASRKSAAGNQNAKILKWCVSSHSDLSCQ